jgi:hypothetical protein
MYAMSMIFLLSFLGPKSKAAHILKAPVQYLWDICKLEVNTDKVGITHHKKITTVKLGIPLKRLFNRFAE